MQNVYLPIALMAILFLPGYAKSQTSTASALKVEGDPTLTLDPACNACKGAHLDLKIRNDSAQDVPLSFSDGKITSKPEDKPFPAEVNMTPLGPNGSSDTTRSLLKAHESMILRVQIMGVLGEATWTIPLLNQGVGFADFRVINAKPDFAIKLESTTDSPELRFESGKPTTVTLKNDSEIGYSAVATYTVDAHTASLVPVQGAKNQDASSTACDSNSKQPNQPCVFKIPAHSSVLLNVTPAKEWFNLEDDTFDLSKIGYLLKDQPAEGRLQVQMGSGACPLDPGAPILSFKIKTLLAGVSKTTQSVSGTAIIALALLAGGVLSLMLNFFLPMQDRRRRLKARAQQAGRKISDLSMALDSRVRVPVGVERQRLAQRIKDLSVFNPQYGPEVTEIEQSLDRLMKRLDLLEQMQRSLSGYWRHQQHDLPASLVRQVENIRKQAVDLLQKSDPSDADLQKVLGLIQEIDNQQMSVGQANVTFAQQLIDELTRRKNERTAGAGADNGPLMFNWLSVPGFPAGFFEGFYGLFNGLGLELNAAPQTVDQTQPEDYAPLDALRIRVNLLDRFRKLLPMHPAPTTYFVNASKRFLTQLQDTSWDSLNRAERALRQMEEGIFPEDIIDHVQQDGVRIKVDRIMVRQFEPAEIFLDFDNRALKGAAARAEFTYRWYFDHDDLSEDGWAVSHYFPYATVTEIRGLYQSVKYRVRRLWRRLVFWVHTGTFATAPAFIRQPYNLRAMLIRNDGTVVQHDIIRREGPLQVHPPLPSKGHALIAEVFRLGLALGLAVLGLIAGAKDQILKLDVLPALIAVFLLGFGADQIKNLLSQQPPGK